VTTAATTTRGAGRPRLVPVLLALSLALNLCFVGGAVWIRLHPPAMPLSPAERAHDMALQLGLDASQQAAFDRYVAAMRAGIQQMREGVAPAIGEAWSELAKPGANETAVMQRFDDAAQKRRSFQQQLTTDTLAFLATLTPEQRGKFVDLARRHPSPWSPSRPEHEGGH